MQKALSLRGLELFNDKTFYMEIFLNVFNIYLTS